MLLLFKLVVSLGHEIAICKLDLRQCVLLRLDNLLSHRELYLFG